MNRFFTEVRGFLAEDDGASMIEYALLIGLVALVVAATLLSIGTAVRNKFSSASVCLAGGSNC
ncbi:MAG: Flp family type IVb pilin [Gemmatimonadaceae bacterium]